MTRWYVDSSVALHALLPQGDQRAVSWFDEVGKLGSLYSSTLLELEVVRALRRDGLNPANASIVLDRLELVSISDGTLRAAATIETHVKSLDAIHLATCGLLGPGLTIVTHDAAMTQVAQHLGFATTDPIARAS